MKVAVVGGSGFIGSHVVDKLLEHGHDVTVFDIMNPHRQGIRQVYINIADLTNTTVALTGEYDAIYHLAAMADVNDVFRNPAACVQVNVLGVANVLEAARVNQIGRVILASTTWVYSAAYEGTTDEEAAFHPHLFKHVYTATKLSAETLCHGFQTLYNVPFTILRYGIPYGPRGRMGSVVANFVSRALKGEPITILGDGRQYRNFIYVEDLAEGNVAALSAVAQNKVYNLEGKKPVTIREIAELVQQYIGNVTIEYKEARPGDFGGRTAVGDKAQRELGWEPKVDFPEGLRRYIEWYKSSR